jgi:hypothetical protein
MIPLGELPLSQRLCNVKILSMKSRSSHEGRDGSEAPAWDEQVDLSGQPTQIFDGPIGMSKNDSKHEMTSSRRDL